jgi:hypothetical protein
MRAPFESASIGERSDSKRTLYPARTSDGLIAEQSSSVEMASLDIAGGAPGVKGIPFFTDPSNVAVAPLVSDRHLVGTDWFNPSWTDENESGCPGPVGSNRPSGWRWRSPSRFA